MCNYCMQFLHATCCNSLIAGFPAGWKAYNYCGELHAITAHEATALQHVQPHRVSENTIFEFYFSKHCPVNFCHIVIFVVLLIIHAAVSTVTLSPRRCEIDLHTTRYRAHDYTKSDVIHKTGSFATPSQRRPSRGPVAKLGREPGIYAGGHVGARRQTDARQHSSHYFAHRQSLPIAAVLEEFSDDSANDVESDDRRHDDRCSADILRHRQIYRAARVFLLILS